MQHAFCKVYHLIQSPQIFVKTCWPMWPLLFGQHEGKFIYRNGIYLHFAFMWKPLLPISRLHSFCSLLHAISLFLSLSLSRRDREGRERRTRQNIVYYMFVAMLRICQLPRTDHSALMFNLMSPTCRLVFTHISPRCLRHKVRFPSR